MSTEDWRSEDLCPLMPQSVLLFDGAWCAAVARVCPTLLLYLVKYRLRREARMALHWFYLKQLAFQVWIREPPLAVISEAGMLEIRDRLGGVQGGRS